jgi:hypothetical protein
MAPRLVLQELLAGVTDRVVIAVTFLAMLEMVKIRELIVEQDEPWGPIRCRPTTPAERRDDRPPGQLPASGTPAIEPPAGEEPATVSLATPDR